MPNCGNNKNPLQHNGTSQGQRQLPALQNDYAKVDEKRFADWIVFAKNFSHYLNYYDSVGAQSGNWSAFFSNDICALLGDVAVQDVDTYKRKIKSRFDFIIDDKNKLKTNELKTKLNELFSVITSFAQLLDNYYNLLPGTSAFRLLIENVVRVNLAKPFKQLLQYYEAANELHFLNGLPGDEDKIKVFGGLLMDASNQKQRPLSDVWWKYNGLNSWSEYYTVVETNKDDSIFGDHGLAVYKRIAHAANHNLFAAIFQQFLMAYSRLVTAAEKELMTSLEKRNDHTPHYALFLTFLKLFRIAQDSINTITQRHLDFYFSEFLQLKPKSSLPNSVHLMAELAKPVDDFVLTSGALFKAGKDSSGKEVLYDLKQDTVFNKASIVSLRAVYFGTQKDNYIKISPSANVVNTGRLFAAPVINSADGMGAELTSDNKEWHPFANKVFNNGVVTAVPMPKAEIGFAVASHYFYLQEGKRNVMLRFTGTGLGSLGAEQVAVYITTEKKWYKIPAGSFSVSNSSLQNTATAESCREISFTLDGDVAPVVNYNTTVHGGTLAVNSPVVKIILLNEDSSPYKYQPLQNIAIAKLQVEVSVGKTGAATEPVNGVKKLLVTTSAGIVDTSKPFQPFGAMPEAGAEIIIGNREIFTKKHAKFRVNINWVNTKGGIMPSVTDLAFEGKKDDDTANPDVTPDVGVSFLKKGIWSKKNDSENDIPGSDGVGAFISGEKFVSPEFTVPAKSIVPFTESYETYSTASTAGFCKFVLKNSFGFKKYMLAQSVYLINKANNITPNPEPAEPYTPVAGSIMIDYSACSDVVNMNADNAEAFNERQVSFFHIGPFGDAEQHKYLNKNNTQFLLPQFDHDVTSAGGGNAEFYIGLEKLEANQSVNILFQVMDGTTDPLVEKPLQHIHWSYMGNNKWMPFPKQNVSDNTMQLLQPGIIQFSIPADATDTNTIMPGGLLWIKASVYSAVGAVCKLLDVKAQAAIATFKNNDNASDFGTTVLPAETISKLKTPLAAIKKLSQPYSSFGGRTTETGTAFYTRVSERLRHKSRAVTIWDYEHLILEAFPQIHKVKCLNHTKSVGTIYNEIAPGHVTIITIPDLKNRNDSDKLRPYTSLSTLEAIRVFLQNKISSHAQVRVINPDFEQVRMHVHVKLASAYNDFSVYSKKLQEDITAFLSPWAYGESDIGFGGKIYKSAIINFIEERPYVDFVTDVEMAHLNSAGQVVKPDNDDIVATTAKGVLVSVPAVAHAIYNYEADDCLQHRR